MPRRRKSATSWRVHHQCACSVSGEVVRQYERRFSNPPASARPATMGVLLLLSTLSLFVFPSAESNSAGFDLTSIDCLHEIGDSALVGHNCEIMRSARASNLNDSWAPHLDLTDDQTPDDSSDPAFLPSMSVEKLRFRDRSVSRGVVRAVAMAGKAPSPLRC